MKLFYDKASQMLDTAWDGFSVLVEHESNAVSNQLSGLMERVAVARKARSVGELLRNQMDLLPDTHARFKRDHTLRGELLKGLHRDLFGNLGRGKL